MAARGRRAVVSSRAGATVSSLAGATLSVVVFSLALGACSADSTGTPTPNTTTTTSTTAAATASPSVSGTAMPSPIATVPGGSGTTAAGGVPGMVGITISRTGGIAGVMQLIVINADGSWTFTDKRAGGSQQGKLTTAQRDQISQLARDPAIASESRAIPPAACADGFIYTIGLGEQSLRYEQCGNARPVTDQLLKLVTDATPM